MSIKSFAIKSFGCKVNQYEEQVLRENLLKNGLKEENIEKACYVIINSCTVTGQADKKTIQFIKKIKRINPTVKTVLTGCLAVLEEDINRMMIKSEIDLVIPNPNKMLIPALLADKKDAAPTADFVAGISELDSHTRAFVKIQDGCDQSCAYCKVTIVRGPSRSRGVEPIVNEVRTLLKNGYKEIVLTGICIGLWKGPQGEDLADLLKRLISLPGKFRIRLSSIEPNHIVSKLILLMSSSEKICKHLHIPLQSGSDKILNLMGRKYNISYFKKIIESIRSKIFPVGISLDIIAGFPGENETDFTDTLEFIKDIYPSRLHVFRYSDRPGTRSFLFKEKIPVNIAKKRVKTIISLGHEMQKDFHKNFIGKQVEILVEEHKDLYFKGYSSEYSRVKFYSHETKVGELVKYIPQNFDENEICLF